MSIPRKGDWFQTYTGKQFWPLDPRSDDFCIEDIAHALSQITRFGGHCQHFYSVAQHSCLVSDVLFFLLRKGDRAVAYEGLMHDATEAYIGDMVRPLKSSMPIFQDAEGLLWKYIAGVFGLAEDLDPSVKTADNLLLMTERRDLMKKTEHLWHPSLEALPTCDFIIRPWTSKRAEREFLWRYNQLKKQ